MTMTTEAPRRALPRSDDDPTSRGLVPVGHHCEDGWLGRDAQERPVPCLVCRPHLRRNVDMRTGRVRWTVRREGAR